MHHPTRPPAWAAAALAAVVLVAGCSSSGSEPQAGGTAPTTAAPAATPVACPPAGPIDPATVVPTTGGHQPEGTPAPTSGPYATPSPLDDQPFDPATAARLQAVLDSTLPALGHSPGAIALVWAPGRGTWQGAAGLADVTSGAPADTEAFFRMGSVTKTFTAMTVLRLVDAGLLGLDDPVGTWFPAMADGDQITVRQLANMTSGIGTYTGADAPEFLQRMAADGAEARFQPEELAAWGLALPRVAAPGERFFYSNTATVMLQLIAEQAGGKPYPQLLQELVLDPLHLGGTAYPAVDDRFLPRPAAHGLFCDDGSIVDVTDWNPSWGAGAGAMTSTLDDLATWTYQLGTGGLVSPATFAAQTDFVPINDAGWGYGVGLADFGGWWGHNGGLPGYTTYAVYNPSLGVVLVLNVSSNFDIPTEGGGAPDTPATVLFRAFDEALRPGVG